MSWSSHRTEIRTAAQWASGLSIGLRELSGGGVSFRSVPSAPLEMRALPAGVFAIDVAAAPDGAIFALATDRCGSALWSAASRELPAQRLLGLEGLSAAGAPRLWARRRYLWIAAQESRRAWGLDPRSLQIVLEHRLPAQALDLAVTDDDSICGLYSPALPNGSRLAAFDVRGREIPLRGAELLRDPVAVATERDGTFVVYDRRGPALIWLAPDRAARRRAIFPGDPIGDARVVRLVSGADGTIHALVARTAAASGAAILSFDREGAFLGGVPIDGARFTSLSNGVAQDLLGVAEGALFRFPITANGGGQSGRYYTRTLDSGPRSDARWQRVDLEARLPPGTVMELRYASLADGERAAHLSSLFDRQTPSGERIAELEVFLGELWSTPVLFEPDPPTRDDPYFARAIALPRSALLRGDPVDEAATGPGVPRYAWVRIDLRALSGAEGMRGREPGIEPEIRALSFVRPRMSYLRYLPAIYQADPASKDLLERYLSAVEMIFSGVESGITRLEECFDPQRTPRAFLAWLGRWIGFSVDPLWDEATMRRFLAEAAAILRAKGTTASLVRAVELVTGQRPAVLDGEDFGVLAVLGRGAALGTRSVLAPRPPLSGRIDAGRLGALVLGAEVEFRQRASLLARPHHVRIELAPTSMPMDGLQRLVRRFVPAHVDSELVLADSARRVGSFVEDARRDPLGSLRLGRSRLGDDDATGLEGTNSGEVIR
ncbi:MAG: hypothetical protein JNM84_25975 [Planctomycetes bacterium]|nr:hypothetical protein [Planctomycetota bacterium]